MPRLTRRPALLLPVLAVAASFALTACGNNGVAEESQEHSVVTGASGQVGDIKVLDATLTTGLTTETATLSFTLADEGQSGDALTGLSSPVAASFSLPSSLSGASGSSTSSVDASASTSPSTSASASTSASTDAAGASSTSSTATIPAMGVLALNDLDAVDVSGLTGSPRVGDSVPVTFTFAGAGAITLQVPVVNTSIPASSGTPTPAVTGANVDNGNPSPAVSGADG